MDQRPTFLDLYRAGKLPADAIDDHVATWHDGDSSTPLHTYLGMTRTQYRTWVQDGTLPTEAEDHRASRSAAGPASATVQTSALNSSAAYRLDTAKLMRDVDRARRAGAPDEISYREIARRINVGSSVVFDRMRKGRTPTANTLCSLLMWLDPRASIADYVLPADPHARRTRRVPQTPPPVS